MDGAPKQTVSLAEAMEVAWADCQRRLAASEGRLTRQIADSANLAAAMHMARQVRQMLLEDVPQRPAVRRLQP